MGAEIATYSYAGARRLLAGAVALIYFAVFVSLSTEVSGLIGHGGIVPAGPGDGFLRLVCLAGAALVLLAFLDFAPGPCLLAAWCCALYLVDAAPDFLGASRDALFLEAGLLTALWAPWRLRPAAREGDPPADSAARLLLLWLLFRLMFGSGLYKLQTGDPSWRTLTALGTFLEIQPFPSWLAWYAHQLPHWLHTACTALVLIIEGPVPFLVFMRGRRPRVFAFAAFVTLQLAISLLGNFSFFNLLSAALCLPLLDDEMLRRFLPPALAPKPAAAGASSRRGWRTAAAVPLILVSGFAEFGRLLPARAAAAAAAVAAGPLHLAGFYAPFGIIPPEHLELEIEGSDDGETWKPYLFRYKPQDLGRRPPLFAFFSPAHIDWQMSRTPLDSEKGGLWLPSFMNRLLEGSPAVLALLSGNPFPDAPPRQVRAALYRYRFTSSAERREGGAWWAREYRGLFLPVAGRSP